MSARVAPASRARAVDAPKRSLVRSHRRVVVCRAIDASNERSRRDVLGASALALAALVVDRPARAADLTRYVDPALKFSLQYPSDWVVARGSVEASDEPMGGRERDVWTIYPAGANARDVNVTIVATPSGADFTKMGSLGDAYGFGMGLVAPLHKPKVRKGREDRVQRATLVDSVAKGEYYKVEYEFERPAAGIDSIFFVLAGLGYDGRVGHLYTTTAQYPREEEAKWRGVVEAIVDSVEYPKTLYG